jgi:hypothetical protein
MQRILGTISPGLVINGGKGIKQFTGVELWSMSKQHDTASFLFPLLNHALRANIAVPCYEMLFYGRIIQMELFEILWPRFRL